MEHQGLVGVQRERGLSLLKTLFSPDASMPGLAARPSPPPDDECGHHYRLWSSLLVSYPL